MRITAPLLISASLLLTGCIYHQPIEQGNVLTQKNMQRIHNGMSRSTVLSILGDPVMENIYKDNRLVYVYTLQPSANTLNKTKFIVTFRNGVVISTQ